MSNSLIKAISLLAAAAIGAALVNAATVDSPDAVVASFNQAITERDMDAAMAHFVPGGVQFNLRPSHGGLETGPLTAELEARWRMIGPVLFSATSSYSRTPKVIDAHVDGDVATVWVQTSTKTVLSSSGEASTENFSELYLLFKTEQGWRIAGVVDNRQPDDIGIGSAQPAG
jgi:ketosteroid isomerase-like protein